MAFERILFLLGSVRKSNELLMGPTGQCYGPATYHLTISMTSGCATGPSDPCVCAKMILSDVACSPWLPLPDDVGDRQRRARGHDCGRSTKLLLCVYN